MENNMGNASSEFGAGITFGLIFGIFLFAMINGMPFTDASKYKEAIRQCEKSLPRDEHCVVIGIPVSKD